MLAILKEQCLLVLLLVMLNLKEQSPPDQKHVLYQLLQLGQSSFDSIVVCWLNFESAIPASCRPRPEGTKPLRIPKGMMY